MTARTNNAFPSPIILFAADEGVDVAVDDDDEGATTVNEPLGNVTVELAALDVDDPPPTDGLDELATHTELLHTPDLQKLGEEQLFPLSESAQILPGYAVDEVGAATHDSIATNQSHRIIRVLTSLRLTVFTFVVAVAWSTGNSSSSRRAGPFARRSTYVPPRGIAISRLRLYTY